MLPWPLCQLTHIFEHCRDELDAHVRWLTRARACSQHIREIRKHAHSFKSAEHLMHQVRYGLNKQCARVGARERK